MTNSYFELQKVWSSNLPVTTKALTPKYFSVSPSLINLGLVGGSFQNRIFKSSIVLYIYIYTYDKWSGYVNKKYMTIITDT